MAGVLYNLIPTTSYDYGSLALAQSTEVVHGPQAIRVIGGKELVLLVRLSAKIIGTGTISVIVRQVFPSDDDASDVTGTDLLTQSLATVSAPGGVALATTSNIPAYVRVLTKFAQSSSVVGALVCRQMVQLIVRDQ
jgi:hypothetical protein